jgi:hypothetical protein
MFCDGMKCPIFRLQPFFLICRAISWSVPVLPLRSHILCKEIEIYDGDLYLRKFDRESSNITRSRIMNHEQVLGEIEEVFEKNGIYLEREFELGLEISNRKTLEEELKT